MSFQILILGASYGSLLGTKLAMAGHDVSLVCREKTAALINAEGTEVRLKLRGEESHRAIRSANLPGKVDAVTPEAVDVARYDMVGLAMQEPQYGAPAIAELMAKIAAAGLPCLSIMNMPPLAYLKRLPGLDTATLEDCFVAPRVWDAFDPDTVTLCSPDPQAFRPPEEGPNVLQVGLPTNFKAAAFGKAAHTEMLRTLAAEIDAVRLDGHEVPVKLRVYDSLFVPLAKWSMLLTGNYRCIQTEGERPIKEAVHGDAALSAEVYAFVDAVAQKLGADPADQVPFEKYAKAAESLLKPSSAARAVGAGATAIERVDQLVQLVGQQLGMTHADVDRTVDTVSRRLAQNRAAA